MSGQRVVNHSPNDAWKAALAKAKAELGDKDYASFVSGHTFASCLQAITRERAGFSLQIPGYVRALQPALDFLVSFEKAISSLTQSHPEVACLVWGSVQFLLIIASKFSKCLVDISDMLVGISRTMPRVEQYASLFPTHDRLHLRLVDMYTSFILFCARAFRFLKTKPWYILIKLAWKSLDAEFKRALDAIRSDARDFEKEAKASSVAVGFEREEHARIRHQEVMLAIPRAIDTIVPPRLHFAVPHLRDDRFQGRDVELDDLHRVLTEPTPAGQRSLKVVAIQGLGGSGKTTLASEYGYRFRSAHTMVFWLKAESQVILQQEYHAQVVKHLQTTSGSPALAAEADLQKLAQAARNWLSTTDTPWLLIFDNVNNPTTVHEYWPNGGDGAIICTTRDRDVADSLSAKQLRLDGFDDDQGSLLLLSQSGHNEPPSDMSRKIVRELGGLPLALRQMGSYIRQTRCTLSEFYNLLRERKNSRRLYSDALSASSLRYTETLATCCELSFARLSKSTRHLFNVLSFFQTDGVDETLFTGGCATMPRLSHLADPLEWNNAVRMLTKYHLLSRSPSPGDLAGGQLLAMHRVNKLHALHTLDSAADRSSWADALHDAVGLLHQAFPSRPADGSTMCKDWAACSKWLPHVLSMKEEFDFSWPSTPTPAPPSGRSPKPPRALCELLANCAYFMWERGVGKPMAFAQTALDVCDLALGADEADADPIRADVATIMGALKLPVFSTRRECLGLFQQALALRQRWVAAAAAASPSGAAGTNDLLQLANAYNNTGAAHLVLEEYDSARPLFQKALSIKLTLGDEASMPYSIGLSYYNLCRVEMGQGRMAEALENCRRAVELVERANGTDDFRSNQFRFSLANLLVACGDVDAGLRVHEATLAIRVQVMGSLNNDTGVSYYGLACVLERLGRFAEALKAVDSAIEAFQNYDDGHDRLARCFFRKSLILAALVREVEAEEALEAAQGLMAKVLGVSSCASRCAEDYDSLVSYYNK